ncbi:ETS-related transcription factor Elf-3 isoform X2 [Corvus hawaiiensis]|uniref:ETS-related transcription factor Elf-3 isoform X2 n=1 Tax=Corvus hawaiiensis TaxID=134902 RepID=UPI00201A0504|nr:ETS-related transcription factor Elf-3 isoform X2 [Corvus hawaiiensis]
MAGSCEISNIFSNYISAMYQPDEVQPTLDMLGHLGDDSSLGLSLPASQPPTQSTDKPEWFSELPYFWTKVQVLEWISYHVEKNKYDASSIDFSCCNMDGHTLCHCSRDQMRLIFGPLGDELYDRLHEITSDELNWIIDLLEKEDATSQTFLNSSHLELGNPCAKDSLEDLKPTNPFTDFTCLPGAMSPGSSDVSGPVMSHSPNSQDSGGSDLDLDPAESKLFPDAPRGTHLWEFIRDILIHPELNEGLMKWEDRREGVFKFLRSEAVAQLWGQKKKNSSMTYEKLSRAMRYYYKREILERVDGRRLVYKFGKNSSGWKEEEVLNRDKEL